MPTRTITVDGAREIEEMQDRARAEVQARADARAMSEQRSEVMERFQRYITEQRGRELFTRAELDQQFRVVAPGIDEEMRVGAAVVERPPTPEQEPGRVSPVAAASRRFSSIVQIDTADIEQRLAAYAQERGEINGASIEQRQDPRTGEITYNWRPQYSSPNMQDRVRIDYSYNTTSNNSIRDEWAPLRPTDEKMASALEAEMRVQAKSAKDIADVKEVARSLSKQQGHYGREVVRCTQELNRLRYMSKTELLAAGLAPVTTPGGWSVYILPSHMLDKLVTGVKLIDIYGNRVSFSIHSVEYVDVTSRHSHINAGIVPIDTERR